MNYIWFSLIPSSPFLIYGIVMLAAAHRHKYNIRYCTEAVNARILSLKKQNMRTGYKYIYQVRYSRQGVQYTPSFTTRVFLGETGDDTTLYIDPSDHKRYVLPDASVRITYHVVSAIVFFALTVLFLFVGVDIMNS